MSTPLDTGLPAGSVQPATEMRYTRSTALLDYGDSEIGRLVASRGWQQLPERKRIKAVHDFVRDEIRFGYNASDDLPATEILQQGYGQCNTKATVLMALLRGVGVPCRLHGFTIDNALQKGAIPAWLHRLAPAEILHSWVEVRYEGRWLNLEGFILDKPYLQSIQRMFPATTGSFCGYGIATRDFRSPPIEWNGGDTYIQREGIARDFGTFDDPDSFYAAHGTNLHGIKRLAFEAFGRRIMNRNVARLRRGR